MPMTWDNIYLACDVMCGEASDGHKTVLGQQRVMASGVVRVSGMDRVCPAWITFRAAVGGPIQCQIRLLVEQVLARRRLAAQPVEGAIAVGSVIQNPTPFTEINNGSPEGSKKRALEGRSTSL